jgi:hypothetical protein
MGWNAQNGDSAGRIKQNSPEEKDLQGWGKTS